MSAEKKNRTERGQLPASATGSYRENPSDRLTVVFWIG